MIEKKKKKYPVLPPIRCSEKDKAIIRDNAQKADMSVSQYLREMGLNGEVRIITNDNQPQENFALIYQLQKIGVNLNQLTKIANETGDISPELSHVYKKLDGLLDELITIV